MEKGFVKFFKADKGFGWLTKEDGLIDVFFHINNVKDELSVLLLHNKAVKEPVVFETKPSEKFSGQLEATSVSLDLDLRKVGYIEYREGAFGQDLYFIKDYYSDDMYFLHHNCFRARKTLADKFISFEEKDPVLFTPNSNERGLIADDVVLIDTRSFIQGFAEFQNFNDAINQLETLCETENWDYIQNETKSNPILRSYINQTCKRINEQGKLVEGNSSRSGETYAYFNTGLVDDFQNEIFAYFVKNKRYVETQQWGVQIPKWCFLEFNTDQSVYFKYFTDIPDIATYLEETDTRKLIFDTTITIRPNWEHLNNRKKRVDSAEIQNMTEQEFRDAIEDSVTMAKKRIKRNYKTAIPHYYNGDIQFLVPLCERKNRGKALAAMVIHKSEQIYEVSTILTLDQAYNNARLLAKPDREWLNP